MRNTLFLSLFLIFFIGVFTGESSPQGSKNNKQKLDPNAFFDAASTGDLVTMKKMIKDGVNVNMSDAKGISPLMIAAAYGKPKAVSLLIQSGADINAEDEDGNTALLFANQLRYNEEMAKDGDHREAIRILVSMSMPINIFFPDGLANFGDATITNYEHHTEGSGFEFAYEASGISASIFVYNYGLEKIPDGIRSSTVKNHIQVPVNDLYQLEEGNYVYGIMEVDQSVTSADNRDYLIASYNFFNRKHTLMTVHYLLTGYKNHFIKIRFSYDSNMGYYAQSLMDSFLKSANERLK
ncbi:MAG: ankyrin repeat domain-containing protein [Leptospirales bacterium]